ncbi:MAG: transketolase [Phycisphaerales bacterium]|nr:transketolase [Phycisphaerales bacterium]
MSFEAAVHAKAVRLDSLALNMTAASGSGHPTTALSLGHIVTCLLYEGMRWVPENPGLNTSDRLVLSEGHAVPIVYAAFADLGVMIGKPGEERPCTVEDLDHFRESDSPLDGHPNPMEGVAFFDAATGSLGQGLSVAAGLGLAAREDGIDQRIYCVIGDGESREGQIWEAVDFIMDHDLTNVLPIINCNGLGQAAAVSPQQSPERIAAKLEAAGVTVITIDGHNPAQIRKAFDTFAAGPATPMAVVARTVKGWGVPSMQGGGWHGKPAKGELLTKALQELASTGSTLSVSVGGDSLTIHPPTTTSRREAEITTPMTMKEAADRWDMRTLLQAGTLSTRKAYGLALRALGHTDSRVWALDADTQNSTFAEWFAQDADLSSRFAECRIAEQNMMSAGAGLAAAGKVPFCSTFGKFLTRAYDQIEMAMNSGANLKCVGSHSGISLAADGPSQMSLPDTAWFRSLGSTEGHSGGPGCWTLQPSDAYSAFRLTQLMAEHDGLCYMRVHRPEVEFLYNEDTEFEFGGMETLVQGRDLLIVSSGFMVHECNKALDGLDELGIDVSLVDCYSLPLNEEKLLDLANENGGNVLVVEDNYGGGLFSAVSEACAQSGDGFRVEPLLVTRIPKSARSEQSILEQCGVEYTDIINRAAAMLGVSVRNENGNRESVGTV